MRSAEEMCRHALSALTRLQAASHLRAFYDYARRLPTSSPFPPSLRVFAPALGSSPACSILLPVYAEKEEVKDAYGARATDERLKAGRERGNGFGFRYGGSSGACGEMNALTVARAFCAVRRWEGGSGVVPPKSRSGGSCLAFSPQATLLHASIFDCFIFSKLAWHIPWDLPFTLAAPAAAIVCAHSFETSDPPAGIIA
ncbi:hypothetical protein R3P38DRAFT_3212005 [Favolaschia claudopus]|uniref:Uncharacterized protein n=1 Tax=Favolaschia claudopus TaxID=2862362 RepID=A0AAW0AEZ5_9AGAR